MVEDARVAVRDAPAPGDPAAVVAPAAPAPVERAGVTLANPPASIEQGAVVVPAAPLPVEAVVVSADVSSAIEVSASAAPAPFDRDDAPAAAPAPLEQARLLARGGKVTDALAVLRALAGRGEEPDEALELRAELAARAGESQEAATALLARALRARNRAEPLAAERLAEAGLAAIAAGVAGGDEALRDALARAPGRETARAALEALAALAKTRGDAGAERAALADLVPLLPTGKRPAALLRRSALAAAAGERVVAYALAEEARALAPRDPSAVEASRATAEAAGDRAAVAARLADLAALDPERAGERLLDRARILEALGDVEGADEAYRRAAAALPPDRAVADAHTRLRRCAGLAAAAEPLEAFARRAPPGEAARALRAAAAVALEVGDWDATTRAARRAFARTQDDLSFAGPLLARVLYLRGAGAEALVLHRRLVEGGLAGVGPDDAITIVAQLTELAEDAGERDLALEAYDRLLELRPHDVAAARRRFALDPDRRRAVRVLAEAADACRSAHESARAFVEAAEAAAGELSDLSFAERLLRGAAAAASRDRATAGDVARRRAALARLQHGAGSQAYVDVLRDAAEAARRAGDRGTALDLLRELAGAERDRGDVAAAGRDLLAAKTLADEDGDAAAAGRLAREAGELLLEGGDVAAAMDALGEAVARDLPDVVPVGFLDATEAGGDAAKGERATPNEEPRSSDEGPGEQGADAPMTRVMNPVGRVMSSGACVMGASSAGTSSAPQQTTPGREANDSGSGATTPGPEGTHRASEQTTPGRDANDSGSGHEAGEDGAAALAGAAESGAKTSATKREVVENGAVERTAPSEERGASGSASSEAAALADRARELEEGEPRAAGLREAARAFFAAGEDERAREALVEAFGTWPADAAAFAAALRVAATNVGRLDVVLSARARAVPAEAAACHRARADALGAWGEVERAIGAYDAALAAAPDDVVTLAALAACLANVRGDDAAEEVDRRVAALADLSPAAVPPAIEAPSRYRLGLAACANGRPEDGTPHLERAVRLAPSDPRAALARAALASATAGAGRGGEAGLERLPAAVDADASLAAARDAAERALAETDPAARAAAFVESAEHLLRAGAPGDEVRAALDLACDADPDAPAPWQARAAVEAALGDVLAAARAHLSVSIRAEGEDAARAALEAASLFEEAGDYADAARAYRAALHARPDAVPEGMLLAAQALAAGDPDAAADHLAAIAAEALSPAARVQHTRCLSRALAAAGRLEVRQPVEPDDVAGAAEEGDGEDSPERGAVSVAAPAEVAAPRIADPIVTLLRSYASAAAAAERADVLESLAGHLERAGDRAGAADALIEAVALDPERDLTYAWLESLVEGDPERLARAEEARAGVEIPSSSVPLAAIAEAPAAVEQDGFLSVEELPELAELTRMAAASLDELTAPEDLPRADALTLSSASPGETELAWFMPSATPTATLDSVPPERLADPAAPRDATALADPPSSSTESPADLAARGRAHLAAAEWSRAHELLSAALALDPSDLTVARDLSRVAEKVGRYGEYVELGELCADAIAAYDPLAAAARYRHFGEVIRARIDDPERAAVMLEKALALVPDDADTRRELVALLSARPETVPRALDAWLELARRDPVRHRGAPRRRGALPPGSPRRRPAASARASPSAPGSPRRSPRSDRAHAGPPAAPVCAGRAGSRRTLRDRVAAPGATGPLARLLSLLSPWLEPLFPADLGRRGALPTRPARPAARAGARARRSTPRRDALGGRPFAPFLVVAPRVRGRDREHPAARRSSPARTSWRSRPAGLAFLAARAVDLARARLGARGQVRAARRRHPARARLPVRGRRAAFPGAAPRSGPARSSPALESAGSRRRVAQRGARRSRAAASHELGGTDPRASPPPCAAPRTASRSSTRATPAPRSTRSRAAIRRARAGRRRRRRTRSPSPDLRDLALFALSDAVPRAPARRARMTSVRRPSLVAVLALALVAAACAPEYRRTCPGEPVGAFRLEVAIPDDVVPPAFCSLPLPEPARHARRTRRSTPVITAEDSSLATRPAGALPRRGARRAVLRHAAARRDLHARRGLRHRRAPVSAARTASATVGEHAHRHLTGDGAGPRFTGALVERFECPHGRLRRLRPPLRRDLRDHDRALGAPVP